MSLFYGIYALINSGITRLIMVLFLMVSYGGTAFFAFIHGHGRNGKSGVYDTLDLDKPFAPLIWAAVLLWIVWPLLCAVYDCMRSE